MPASPDCCTYVESSVSSDEEIIPEFGWSIMKDVLGVATDMMRLAFGDVDERVRNVSIALGLTSCELVSPRYVVPSSLPISP
jgi:hypothetical protein